MVISTALALISSHFQFQPFHNKPEMIAVEFHATLLSMTLFIVCAMSCYVLQRAKPTLTRPREYLILERRKQEELREEANAMVNYNKQFDLKVCAPTWIISTKSHSCHRAFLHWSICSRNHLGPHSATAIDKKFLFK